MRLYDLLSVLPKSVRMTLFSQRDRLCVTEITKDVVIAEYQDLTNRRISSIQPDARLDYTKSKYSPITIPTLFIGLK